MAPVTASLLQQPLCRTRAAAIFQGRPVRGDRLSTTCHSFPLPPGLSIRRPRQHRGSARSKRRGPNSAAVFASVTRYGVPEDSSVGGWMQTFGFPLGALKVGREILKFRKGSEAVTVDLPRPLGIFFEEKQMDGKRCCVVDELVEGGNAAASGVVRVGDVLRATTAVAKGADRVTVGRFQVEPSLGQRQAGGYTLAYFVADDQPFDRVMGALTSFANPVDTDEGPVEVEVVSLLLERREEGP